MNPAPDEVSRLLEGALAAFRRDDAAESWHLARQAAELLPDSYDTRNMAGTAALSAGDLEAAIAHFAAAVRLAPDPAAQAANWLGSGRARLGLGETEQALAAFHRGLSLAPNWLPLKTDAAIALQELGRYQEVEALAREILTAQPDNAQAQAILGASILKQDRFEEARSLLAPLRNHPLVGLEARHHLATMRKIEGDIDGALADIRALLKEAPRFPAWAELAQLKRFSHHDDPDFQHLLARKSALDTAPSIERIDLLFALGKAYDDLNEHEQAIACLSEANRLEGVRKPYTPEVDEARMTRIAELFQRDFIHAFPEAGLTGLHPVFVISMPRSGSTLTEQMIAAHSSVQGGGEIGHFARVATELSLRWGARADFPDLDPQIANTDLRSAARAYRDLTAKLTLLHPHFTDKSLQNFLYIGLIRMMLPDARIVHVRRHPLATALGVYRQRFAQAVRYSYRLEDFVRYYRAYAKLMAHWRATLPEAFIEVFYERLVDHPEAELRRIFAYLDLEFEPTVLDFHRLARPIHTASLVQVREPLNRAGLARHEHYRDLLAPVAEELAEEIALYENELAAANGSTSE
jgi:tetratricopeptide (TPR) repeat protein